MSIQLPPEVWSIIIRHRRKQHFNRICKHLESHLVIYKMSQDGSNASVWFNDPHFKFFEYTKCYGYPPVGGRFCLYYYDDVNQIPNIITY